MRYSFDDVLDQIEFRIDRPEEGYAMPMVPKLNTLVGNIAKSDYTVISGLPSSGKASFVDQNYVISTLLQWYLDENRDEIPLKIVYFSMKDDEMKKLQLLLCNYLMLIYNFRIDIPTLRNQEGRLCDLNDEPDMLAALKEAKEFFDVVLDEGILDIVDTPMNPTKIYNYMLDVVLPYGEVKDGEFAFDEGNENALVMMVVDSTDYLEEDVTEFSTLRGDDLKEKMNSYIMTLYKKYFVNCTLIVPAKIGRVIHPKDTQPSHRQLDVYGNYCKKGIMLYNPIEEANKNYLKGEDVSTYVSASSGLNVLRFWELVRNSDGISSVKHKLLFLPGTSYMMEASEGFSDLDEVNDYIYDESNCPFYGVIGRSGDDNYEEEDEFPTYDDED